MELFVCPPSSWLYYYLQIKKIILSECQYNNVCTYFKFKYLYYKIMFEDEKYKFSTTVATTKNTCVLSDIVPRIVSLKLQNELVS